VLGPGWEYVEVGLPADAPEGWRPIRRNHKMQSAEEWMRDLHDNNSSGNQYENNLGVIQDVQEEAEKHGYKKGYIEALRWAAKTRCDSCFDEVPFAPRRGGIVEHLHKGHITTTCDSGNFIKKADELEQKG